MVRGSARRALVVVWAVAALVVAGCAGGSGSTPSAGAGGSGGAPGSGFVLHVLNIDGPTVGIVIGEQVVATVPCGSGTDLRPGDGTSPQLPWIVQVRAASGKVLGTVSYPAGSSGDASIQLRGGQVMIGGPMSGGPSAAPDACSSASPASAG